MKKEWVRLLWLTSVITIIVFSTSVFYINRVVNEQNFQIKVNDFVSKSNPNLKIQFEDSSLDVFPRPKLTLKHLRFIDQNASSNKEVFEIEKLEIKTSWKTIILKGGKINFGLDSLNIKSSEVFRKFIQLNVVDKNLIIPKKFEYNFDINNLVFEGLKLDAVKIKNINENKQSAFEVLTHFNLKYLESNENVSFDAKMIGQFDWQAVINEKKFSSKIYAKLTNVNLSKPKFEIPNIDFEIDFLLDGNGLMDGQVKTHILSQSLITFTFNYNKFLQFKNIKANIFMDEFKSLSKIVNEVGINFKNSNFQLNGNYNGPELDAVNFSFLIDGVSFKEKNGIEHLLVINGNYFEKKLNVKVIGEFLDGKYNFQLEKDQFLKGSVEVYGGKIDHYVKNILNSNISESELITFSYLKDLDLKLILKDVQIADSLYLGSGKIIKSNKNLNSVFNFSNQNKKININHNLNVNKNKIEESSVSFSQVEASFLNLILIKPINFLEGTFDGKLISNQIEKKLEIRSKEGIFGKDEETKLIDILTKTNPTLKLQNVLKYNNLSANIVFNNEMIDLKKLKFQFIESKVTLNVNGRFDLTGEQESKIKLSINNKKEVFLFSGKIFDLELQGK